MAFTLDGVSLPAGMKWSDEKTWTKVSQSIGYGVTGALFIQESVKQKGRHITLVAKEELSWMTRTQVEVLETMRDEAGKQMSLTFPDGRVFNVMFRQGEAFDASPVLDHTSYDPGEYFMVTAIRLMEV